MDNNKHTFRPRIAVLLCYLLLAVEVTAEKPVAPPDPKTMQGTWLGLDEDLRFCRLELSHDSKQRTGYCVIFFFSSPILYSVENWSIENFDIKANLAPIDREGYPLYLRGTANNRTMVVEIGEVGSQWKREFRLSNEQEFFSKSRKAEDRIKKYKKDNHRPKK
jgi:hypothetical protein